MHVWFFTIYNITNFVFDNDKNWPLPKILEKVGYRSCGFNSTRPNNLVMLTFFFPKLNGWLVFRHCAIIYIYIYIFRIRLQTKQGPNICRGKFKNIIWREILTVLVKIKESNCDRNIQLFALRVSRAVHIAEATFDLHRLTNAIAWKQCQGKSISNMVNWDHLGHNTDIT